MEEKASLPISNREAQIIRRYKQRIREVQENQICQNLIHRDTNTLDFYKITPKEELPKFLQKMKFQTLHIKQSNPDENLEQIAASIKVFKKENRKPVEAHLRKKIKQEGQLILLSQIYQSLGEQGPPIVASSQTEHQSIQQTNQLDQWEKLQLINKFHSAQFGLCRQGKEKSRISLKNPKQGYDFKEEIERGLQIIQVTHGSQNNLLNRYTLIENSSKLLKKELDDKKAQIEQTIKSKMKLLYEARTQYHACFEERNRLRFQERFLNDQMKDELIKQSHKSIFFKNEKSQKKGLFDANQAKIARTKKIIEGFEEAIANLEEDMRKILNAQKDYYKITLKNGTDFRQSGLVWVIRKLEMQQADIGHYEFPNYLDRKGKLFLIQKAKKEEHREFLLDQKKKFVNEIGKSSSQGRFKNNPLLLSYNKESMGDRVVETEFRPDNNIPKKYRKSLKKMSVLAEEFIKNSSLLDIKPVGNRNVEISNDLQGLSHKQIYEQVGQRIKKIDLSKMRRDKMGSKGQKLMEYQSLLQKIKLAHIQLQDMDLQHENYLLIHHKQNRNLFFMQAAACFGYRKAYSMIIKHFSWKNCNDHLQKVRTEQKKQ